MKVQNLIKGKLLYIVLILVMCFFVVGCEKKDSDITEQKIVVDETESEDMQLENTVIDITYTPLVSELYDYEIEEKMFAFSAEGNEYYIPYVRISGCPNEQLQWKINHTLWEEACWIFECAELGDNIYGLFDGDTIRIEEVYQYDRFLSVVYKSSLIGRLQGYIVYSIVIDTFTGERVLLADVIEDEEAFKDLLIHYFDDSPHEIGLFIDEEDAEEILNYGGMTEAETAIYNKTQYKYSEENGKIGGVSYMFDAASFYMSEYGFVVLPGAQNFEPLYFGWEEVSEITDIMGMEHSHKNYDVSVYNEMLKDTVNIDSLYGVWLIDSVLLCSESFMSDAQRNDLSECEKFIGCELEYNSDGIRLEKNDYSNPIYAQSFINFQTYNIDSGFQMPGLYGVVENGDVELFEEVDMHKLSGIDLPSFRISVEENITFADGDYLPIGTSVVMLNDNAILVDYMGNYMIAYRVE